MNSDVTNQYEKELETVIDVARQFQATEEFHLLPLGKQKKISDAHIKCAELLHQIQMERMKLYE